MNYFNFFQFNTASQRHPDPEMISSPPALGVLKKLSAQLWYLSEYLIAFVFFDRNVSSSEKRAMIQEHGHKG